MKLYKTKAVMDDGTAEYSWAGTQSDAGKARKYFNSARKIPRERVSTEEVEVPTNKAGLLEFLNGQEAQ